MIYEVIGISTSQAFAVSGTISGNNWLPPVLLSGNDMNVSQIYFALGTNGAGVAAWLSSGPMPEIHAVVKPASLSDFNSCGEGL